MASIGHNELTWPITVCRHTVEKYTNLTNPTLHLSHIPQCTIQNRNVYISVLNGALWDMGQMHVGVWDRCIVGFMRLVLCDYRSQMSPVDLHLSVRGVGHYHLWDNLSYITYRSRCLLQLLMAWCHQATSCYLSQCWLRSVPLYGINRPQWVNMANHCLQSHSWRIDQSHKSHTAPVPYPTMLNSEQKCEHFCSEWCIVGYGTDACWGMGQMHYGIYEIGLFWISDYRSQMSPVDLHLSVSGVGHYHLWDNLSYITYRSRCLLELLIL